MKKAKSRSCFQIYIISENLRHTKTQSVLTRSKSNPITLRLTRFCITSNPEHCGQRPPNINASNCNISFVLFFNVLFFNASTPRHTLCSSQNQPIYTRIWKKNSYSRHKMDLKKVFKNPYILILSIFDIPCGLRNRLISAETKVTIWLNTISP